MKLSNKRSLYSIETEKSDSDIVGLRGEATANAKGEVTNFTGQVIPAVVSDTDPGMAYGNFNYSVTGDRVNQNIDVPSGYHKAANLLLYATIAAIENELKTNEIEE